VDASLANTTIYFTKGVAPAPWSFATDSKVTRSAIDGPHTQEGAQLLTWPAGGATVRIGGGDLNLEREANADLSIQISYKLVTAATGKVQLLMEGGANKGAIDATSLFTGETGTWRTAKILLKCYAQNGVDLSKVTAPFVVQASGPLSFAVADIRIVSDPNNSTCPAAK
jgi:beta-glucosidase